MADQVELLPEKLSISFLDINEIINKGMKGSFLFNVWKIAGKDKAVIESIPKRQ